MVEVDTQWEEFQSLRDLLGHDGIPNTALHHWWAMDSAKRAKRIFNLKVQARAVAAKQYEAEHGEVW